MENFVHASVSHAALAEFGRNARAVGVQLHALEIFEKKKMSAWSAGPSRLTAAAINGNVLAEQKLYFHGCRSCVWNGKAASGRPGAGLVPRICIPVFGRRALEPPARGACTLHEYRACGLCDAAGGIFAGWRARFFEAPLSHEPGDVFSPIIPPPPISRQSWCAVPRAARFPSSGTHGVPRAGCGGVFVADLCRRTVPGRHRAAGILR